MRIEIIQGNIFTTKCQTIVNTVNCVGFMGAGIALEYRLRYPEMYNRYQELCELGHIDIGKLWIYKAEDRWVLNFPTKRDYKYPSKEEYLHLGLQKFVETYEAKEITSVAFPMLGADKGGLSLERVIEIMTYYLADLPIDVEVYRYDPNIEDDLYGQTKAWILQQDPLALGKRFRIQAKTMNNLIVAFNNPKIKQLNQLARVQGVGIKTLEKLFNQVQTARSESVDISQQVSLFG